MNGIVIFMAKVEKFHPRFRGNNLVARYGFPEGSCVIPNKASHMDNKTWAKVGKVVSPGIRNIKVSNVTCVSPIIFSIYITLHICPYKLSSNCFLFPKVVVITHI